MGEIAVLREASAPSSSAAKPAAKEANSFLNAEGFATVYSETFDAVYRYAYVLAGNQAQAEDIAAEVFLRAWRKRASYRGDGRVLSWLLSITHNCAATSLRRGARETPDLETVIARGGEAPAPDDEAVAAADGRQMHALIEALTPEQQQVIVLRFFQDWSHAQIAKELNRKEGAIRAVQHRALRRLRGLMNAQRGAEGPKSPWVDSPSGDAKRVGQSGERPSAQAAAP